MIARETIDDIARKLVAAADPVKVILFGSYARGDADDGSDLDFLAVEREVENALQEMVRLRRAVGSVGVGVDVLVVSEQDLGDRAHLPGTVLYWALKEGRLLHAAG